METAKNSFAIILAEREGFGRVVRCQCGAIHLEAGPLSVSFSAAAYMRFVDLIRASASQGSDEPQQPGRGYQ